MKNNDLHSEIINLTHTQRIIRACSVIIPLCFLSLFLAAAIISVTNDMYAFVKPDETVNVNFPSSSSLYSRAKELERYGVINNPAVFSLYVRSKNYEERVCGFSGELSLNSSMSYREILLAFS
ncbi:MAG: hypothetical protein IJ038_02305 [Clostridia bacterium]|nr:hypothetical protein [Clostridia bacterium]